MSLRFKEWGVQSDFLVKLYLEIAVAQESRTNLFGGTPNPNWLLGGHTHFGSKISHLFNMPKPKLVGAHFVDHGLLSTRISFFTTLANNG